jgi:hypothetical protein
MPSLPLTKPMSGFGDTRFDTWHHGPLEKALPC